MEYSSLVIRDVWQSNLREEFCELMLTINNYPVVSVDTEFPGFLFQNNTPRYASDLQRYDDLQKNVNSTKLIQLGLSLSDYAGNVYYKTFQFNFQFDVSPDQCSPDSWKFKRSTNRFDLERLKTEGINPMSFAGMFRHLLYGRKKLVWVTFHGLYDFGYMLKLVMPYNVLPSSLTSFTRLLGRAFLNVVDLKYMARYCGGLRGGELGLELLAKTLQVKRLGDAHQAGSDCLLTGLVYKRMKELYPIKEEMYAGFLYSISVKVYDDRISYGVAVNVYPSCVGSKCMVMAHGVPYSVQPVFSSRGWPLIMYLGF